MVSIYNEFPSHVVSAFRNDWWKVFSRQIRCKTSQILGLILLLTCHHNPLRNFSSLDDFFSSLFPVFYIAFLLFQNDQPFINILFQSPTFSSTCCYWSYQFFIDIYFVPLEAGRDADPSPLLMTRPENRVALYLCSP